MLVRVAWHWSHDEPDWLFNNTFPMARQPRYQDLWLNFTVYTFQALFGANTRVRFVAVEEESLNATTDAAEAALLNGAADASPPWMWFYPSRFGRFPYVGPISRNQLLVVYNAHMFPAATGLELNRLFPSRLAVPIALLLVGWWTFRLADGLLGVHLDLRLRELGKIPILLFAGIFAGVLRSHITMILNIPPPPNEPFRTIDDVRSALDSGRVGALTDHTFHFGEFLDGGCSESRLFGGLCGADGHNPATQGHLVDQIRLLLTSKERLLFLGVEDDLPEINSQFCSSAGLSAVVLPDTVFSQNGILFARSWAGRVRRRMAVPMPTIRAEYERLRRAYADEYCHSQLPELPAPEPIRLTIGEALPVFQSAAVLLGAAAVALVAESGLAALRPSLALPASFLRLSGYLNVG